MCFTYKETIAHLSEVNGTTGIEVNFRVNFWTRLLVTNTLQIIDE